jgi:hypothetical protein
MCKPTARRAPTMPYAGLIRLVNLAKDHVDTQRVFADAWLEKALSLPELLTLVTT